MEDAEFTEHSYNPIRAGQVILVGTDGVWEMPNAAGEQFGKDRLRKTIRETAGLSAEEISRTIRERLFAFRAEYKAVDDVTFVVVKVTP
jgi:sigma-B regulation protein RsbU (phosphoserine phosphatase)